MGISCHARLREICAAPHVFCEICAAPHVFCEIRAAPFFASVYSLEGAESKDLEAFRPIASSEQHLKPYVLPE